MSETDLTGNFPNDAEKPQEFAIAFEESRVLLAACELDVFTAIGDDQVREKWSKS